MDEIVTQRTGKFSSNSRECVRAINEYWRERGYMMNARVELKPFKFKSGRGEAHYWHEEIVSDSVGGMPVQKLPKI